MNYLPLYLTAFSLGLISSLHCVVMCGPLSMALPVGKLTPSARKVAFLTYNFGRLITYCLLGLLIGLAGDRARVFGWQQFVSILSGTILLIMLFQKYLSRRGGGGRISLGQYSVLYKFISRCSQIKGRIGFLSFGMANGLLPCGMVYFALVTAMNADSLFQSMLFMFIFGTGTFPAMLTLSISSQKLGVETRLRMKKMIPLFISLLAVLLIVRGMNLGIPFLSPYNESTAGQEVLCEP